jgi:hypothetical protein
MVNLPDASRDDADIIRYESCAINNGVSSAGTTATGGRDDAPSDAGTVGLAKAIEEAPTALGASRSPVPAVPMPSSPPPTPTPTPPRPRSAPAIRLPRGSMEPDASDALRPPPRPSNGWAAPAPLLASPAAEPLRDELPPTPAAPELGPPPPAAAAAAASMSESLWSSLVDWASPAVAEVSVASSAAEGDRRSWGWRNTTAAAPGGGTAFTVGSSPHSSMRKRAASSPAPRAARCRGT